MLQLIILEAFPVIIILVGFMLKKPSNYPDVTKGYRSKIATSSKNLWEYANNIASKVVILTASILFIINFLVLYKANFNDHIYIVLFNILLFIIAIVFIEVKLNIFKKNNK